MTRVTKDPEERKEEIIKTAQMLFIKKGFVETKVSDIVKTIGVSQGVFYYYFNSKDEIIDEIISKYMQKIVNGTVEINENNKLSKIKKLEKMSHKQLEINMKENSNIHSIKGVDVHERIMKRLLLDYVPLMQKAFSKSDNQKDLFMVEIFVSSGNILFDPGIFQWSKKEKNARINFLIDFMEKSFNVQEGAFRFYRSLMGYIK